MKPVTLYDTTLRDGTQGTGINFSVTDKLRVAHKLDDFGIDYIEGGWPGSNPKDIEFFAQAKKRKFKNAKLAAFGSTRKKRGPDGRNVDETGRDGLLWLCYDAKRDFSDKVFSR